MTANDTRPRLVLAVLSLAAFMAALDLFVVNVAFDSIGRSFPGSTNSGLSWILNGYAIVYAALLVPAGRLADRVSRKRGFLIGLGIFTAASAACGLSGNLVELVVFRLVQAAGAAALTPTSLGLLLPVFPPEGRATAVRIWAGTSALAAAFGPVVGGFLVQASWRWVFYINVPIGIVAVIASIRWVPDSRDSRTSRIPDLFGAVLVALSVGAVALSLVQGQSWGWGSGRTLAGFIVFVVAGAAFWLRSIRHPVPVVEPALLKVRAFAWSNLTALLFSVGFAANLLTGIFWMQRVWGYGPIRTGLCVAPGPLMVPLLAIMAGVLIKRGVPVGMVAAAGCALFASACLLTVFRITIHPAYAATLLPSQIVGGAGVGLALPTIISAGTADLPPDRSATGSAVVTMSRQLGTVLGVSALIAILGTPSSLSSAHTAFQHAWAMCAAAGLVGALSARGMTPRKPQSQSDPAPIAVHAGTPSASHT